VIVTLAPRNSSAESRVLFLAEDNQSPCFMP